MYIYFLELAYKLVYNCHCRQTVNQEEGNWIPVNAGGFLEQGGAPAQVDDIKVLAKVLPCNPEDTLAITDIIQHTVALSGYLQVSASQI